MAFGLYSFENLWRQYRACRRNKRGTLNQMRFEIDAEAQLLDLPVAPSVFHGRAGAERAQSLPAAETLSEKPREESRPGARWLERVVLNRAHLRVSNDRVGGDELQIQRGGGGHDGPVKRVAAKVCGEIVGLHGNGRRQL